MTIEEFIKKLDKSGKNYPYIQEDDNYLTIDGDFDIKKLKKEFKIKDKNE